MLVQLVYRIIIVAVQDGVTKSVGNKLKSFEAVKKMYDVSCVNLNVKR